MKRKISIVTSCFNEAENMREFYDRCRAAVRACGEDFDYEFIVADNGSTDGTRKILRTIAAEDKKFRVIMNSRNFGHIRSPFHALLNASGDLVFYICSDLQEPPEILPDFVAKIDEGCSVVAGVRTGAEGSPWMELVRRAYYFLLRKMAPDQGLIAGFTGFGLYDRKFMDALHLFHEPYPYFRGLVSEIGFKRADVPYVQAIRKHGKTKNNLFTLYDMALTGMVNHTKLPLRLASLTGFFIALCCLCAAFVYLVLKLIWWDTFQLGLAPLVIGLFFLSAVQLVFVGVIGEYLGAVWTQVKARPHVVEEERINFSDGGSSSE